MKNAIVLAILHFMWAWNAHFNIYHVPGVLNHADAPSRDSQYRGTRLIPRLFDMIWRSVPTGDAITVSAFDSIATAHVPPGWEHLPPPRNLLRYFSLGPDPYSSGVNCFAQSVTFEFCYANPPLALARAAVVFFAESKARAVFVLSPPEGVPPWWWSELVVPFCRWKCPLPLRNSEYRHSHRGWVDVEAHRRVKLSVYLLDFTDNVIDGIIDPPDYSPTVPHPSEVQRWGQQGK